jgi:hypothetical protein
METTEPGDVLNSTLIRRGRSAATFREMIEFARMVEHRPLASLLVELPALAELSQSKFSLATQVLRRRFRDESPIDAEQLRGYADEISRSLPEGENRRRIATVFG